MRSAHAEWAVLLRCSVPTCGAIGAAPEEMMQPRAVQWLCFRCSPRKYRQRRRELQLAQLQDHLLPLLAAIWTEMAVSSAGLGLMTTVLAERRKRASRARIAGADGKSATFSLPVVSAYTTCIHSNARWHRIWLLHSRCST